MTARVCCSLTAALFCLSVYWSTTDAEGAATVNGSVHLAAVLPEGPVKPGVCPKNVEVAVSGVCAGKCSQDRDCPKDQKCCRSGCGRRCMLPYKEGPVKPGVCPKNVEVAVSGVCAGKCSQDSDCPKDQKCCRSGCGRRCMLPYKEGPVKPGVCPKNVEVAVSGVCAGKCSQDSDCPKDQKCCSKGCGPKCVAPLKEKPGVCPSKYPRIGVCAEKCSHDGDCLNDKKCCSNGCGHQCMIPYKEKPGVCPMSFVAVGLCADNSLCSHDGDCPNDEKCCSSICGGRVCTSAFRV
ncbi:WAP four-disulfide core domain protein 3-like isoform X2 [Onychostoma macrolepis]|uniref:WAP four-disulfide core domain protein 3-like isoform X2 n=1 Tax=Onychostoma macrolepis TaxID=369639 RepID=UPI00272BBC13|nr:WAP four-disulfide core domain protein 3-like isoform X2 [Onychostoma macrolepis]